MVSGMCSAQSCADLRPQHGVLVRRPGVVFGVGVGGSDCRRRRRQGGGWWMVERGFLDDVRRVGGELGARRGGSGFDERGLEQVFEMVDVDSGLAQCLTLIRQGALNAAGDFGAEILGNAGVIGEELVDLAVLAVDLANNFVELARPACRRDAAGSAVTCARSPKSKTLRMIFSIAVPFKSRCGPSAWRRDSHNTVSRETRRPAPGEPSPTLYRTMPHVAKLDCASLNHASLHRELVSKIS